MNITKENMAIIKDFVSKNFNLFVKIDTIKKCSIVIGFIDIDNIQNKIDDDIFYCIKNAYINFISDFIPKLNIQEVVDRFLHRMIDESLIYEIKYEVELHIKKYEVENNVNFKAIFLYNYFL